MANLYFSLNKFRRRRGAFDLMNVPGNVVQNPMRKIHETQTRRWTVPISRDQNVGLRFVRRAFPGDFGRYAFAFASIRGRNLAGRVEADAMQNDGFWDRGVIRPVDIAGVRGAHIRKCDEERRQHDNREDYSTQELHPDRVAKPTNCANPMRTSTSLLFDGTGQRDADLRNEYLDAEISRAVASNALFMSWVRPAGESRAMSVR